MASTRHALTLLLASLIACLCLTGTAAASPFTDAANVLRADAGLPAVSEHSDAAVQAAQAAADGYSNPADVYAEAVGADPGTKQPFIYLTVGADWTPQDVIDELDAVALFADPRLLTLDDVLVGDTRVLAGTIDPTVAWTAPLALPRAVDLLSGRPVLFVVPPGGDRSPSLQLLRAGRWTEVAWSAWAPVSGPSGSAAGYTINARELDWNTAWMPFGARLRLVSDGLQTVEITTAGVPSAIANRGFQFDKRLRARDRRAFQSAARAANPAARRMIEQIDDFTTVTRAVKGDRGYAMTDGSTGGYRISISPADLRGSRKHLEFTVLRYLGYLVQFSGLEIHGINAVDKTIPSVGKCRHRVGGACPSTDERLADTFAKWAAGVRRFPERGFNIPEPRSFKRYARTLTSYFQFSLSDPAPAARNG